ncbi:MAG: response regulator transcription factor [Trueperaceae bacterium]
MRRQVARLLLVEDDQSLVALLEEQFGQLGYDMRSVTTGGEALFLAEEEPYDLIVLDLNLPDMDGIEVAEWLQGRTEASILILTARADVDSRVEGLYAGASDYLTKPFSIHELVARVHARLRERERNAGELRYDNLVLDPSSNSCIVEGRSLVLPELEFKLLRLLIGHRGRLFSKDDLQRQLYGPDQPGSNTIEVFVHNLRKKLATVGLDEVIKTVRSKGYLVR